MVETRSRRYDCSGVDIIHRSNAKRKRLPRPVAVEEEDDDNNSRPAPPPLEDRHGEDFVQVFTKKHLRILVKEAVAAYPDLVSSVQSLGKDDFGACSIRAQFWCLKEDPPAPSCSEDDDGLWLEEEPIEELIEALGKDTLEGIVKDAMSKHPDFIWSVFREADVDPAFRLIGVRDEDIGMQLLLPHQLQRPRQRPHRHLCRVRRDPGRR
ncbi:hypothetical protein RHGRI_024061 [Rhododendron griersonianum]|uniref:Uncharacterized protein n=1 Tax=Rhododendron griersonianum TaxID=479676 RepID=A0AAV6J877_9ERIC|nr:hypothetical protein RHGRI_024061 [Rhododendron griersonianum]